jgi:sigma-E factor negative regulatory protein RseA
MEQRVSMTTSKENVSALMDDELHSEQSINALLNDVSASAAWARYHLIGDTLRDDLPTQLDASLSKRIADALDLEPTILAPQPRRSLFAVMQPQISQFMRVVGQYGIAASVAVAVLVGVQQYQNQGSIASAIKQGPVLNTTPVAGSATPVSINYSSERSRNQSQALSEKQLQEERQRIARFIQDHQLQQRLSQVER